MGAFGATARRGLREPFRPVVLTLVPTLLVFGVAACGVLLLQWVCLRLMLKPDVGRVVLAYGVSSVCSTVAGAGIAQVVAREAAANRSELRRRLSLWIASLVAGVPISLALSVAALSLPGISRSVSAFALLFALVISGVCQSVESAFRRADGRFLSGAFTLQGAPAMLALGLLPFAVTGGRLGASAVLWWLAGAQGALAVTSVVMSRPGPQESLPDTVRWLRCRLRLAVGLWVSTSLSIGFRWVDRLVLAAILPLADLANYQSLFVLVGLFDLVGVGLGYVNLPRYAELGRWSRHNLWFATVLGIAVGVVTVAAAFIFGGTVLLIHWSNVNIAALLLLVLVGFLKLVYAESSAAVGGLASSRQVSRYSVWMAVSLAVGVAATVVFGVAFGIAGAAAGALAAWSVRVVVSVRFAARIEMRRMVNQCAS